MDSGCFSRYVKLYNHFRGRPRSRRRRFGRLSTLRFEGLQARELLAADVLNVTTSVEFAETTTYTLQHDFRDGVDNDWNIWLLPVPEGQHPNRDLRLPTHQHADHYLTHSESFDLVSDGLKFTVHPDDAVVEGDFLRDKERAEIGRYSKGESEEGQTVEYTMRAKIPANFAVPSAPRDFVMLTQSHTQRDVEFARGWTMFLGVNAQDRLEFVYGRDATTTETFAAEFGTWWDLTIRVHWSQQDDGWAEVWLDDQLMVPRIYGPNMPTADAMEWKLGLYRGHSVQTTDSMTVQTVSYALLDENPDPPGTERSVQFDTPLSEFRDGVTDAPYVRPNYPDSNQFVDVTNTGTVDLTLFELQINVPDVTADLILTADSADDVTLAPGETRRIGLTYTPSEAGQNFQMSDGLIILSDDPASPSISVELVGASTYNSDVNYDGIVNYGDLGPLQLNFLKMEGDADWDPTADINGDGIVNLTDLGPLNTEFFQTVLEPLRAAEGTAAAAAAAPVDPFDLEVAVARAAEFWGVPQLVNTHVVVSDLGGSYLGLASPLTSTIYIDDDAARLGWSPDGGIDLLTVVTHEMGHLLGWEDLASASGFDHVMAARLPAGVRRLPAAGVSGPWGDDLTEPRSFDLDLGREDDPASDGRSNRGVPVTDGLPDATFDSFAALGEREFDLREPFRGLAEEDEDEDYEEFIDEVDQLFAELG